MESSQPRLSNAPETHLLTQSPRLFMIMNIHGEVTVYRFRGCLNETVSMFIILGRPNIFTYTAVQANMRLVVVYGRIALQGSQ